MPGSDLVAIGPAVAVAATALAALVAGWPSPVRRNHAGVVSLLGLALAGLAAIRLWPATTPPLANGQLVALDSFAIFSQRLLIVVTGLAVLISLPVADRIARQPSEYYALLLLSAAGMMVMAAAVDLIVVFLALETFTVALYVLCAIDRTREGQEAALKYFVLGSFASAFMLYGIALIYGSTGSTNLGNINAALAAAGGPFARLPNTLLLGLALLLVGLGFKVAIAPFHQWTPDVYQGAPTAVTAFMAAGTKVAGFGALMRVLWLGFPQVAADWGPLLALLALVSMSLGNLVALVQSDVKRMLAYSAIAHAGYVLVGLAAGGAGVAAALFYLVPYGLMKLGAFAVVMCAVGRDGTEATHLDDFRGLASSSPGLALSMTVLMFSLTGFPLTAGFVGKFYLFQAAVEGGLTWLAVAGLVNSVVSAFYYVRVVAYMYMTEGPAVRPSPAWPTALGAHAAAVALVALFVLADPLLSIAGMAASSIAP